MAMTLTSRREFYKLREIVHFLLAGAGASIRRGIDQMFVCYFCHKPMHDLEFVTHGNAVGPKFDCSVSIHHVNGNHDDNAMSNKALCHAACHKSYHRREANLAKQANSSSKRDKAVLAEVARRSKV